MKLINESGIMGRADLVSLKSANQLRKDLSFDM